MKTKTNKNPKENAKFLSKLFFWTEFCMVIKYWKKSQYTEDDNYPPLTKHACQALGDKLENAWMGEENFQKTPSLLRALVNVFGFEFFLYGLFYLPVQIGVAVLQPYLLGQVLTYFPKNKSCGYAVLLIVVLFVNTLCYNGFTMGLTTLGMKIRVACSSLIYRRSLRLKENTFRKVKVGQMVNLLSNDVRRFDSALPVMHFIWIGPLELVIVTAYLMMTLGKAALPGVAILCLTVLLQMLVSDQIATRRKSVAVNTDKRVCLMNDIITNIKMIKINTWEQPFLNLIQKIRNLELQEIKRANCLRFTNSTFKFFLTEMCSYFCILAAVSNSIPLTSEFVFVLRSVFDIIKAPLVVNLPDAVTQVAEVKITIRRLQEFLTLDPDKEHVEDNITNSCILKSINFFEKTPPSISATNVSLRCGLTNINFSLQLGELVGIIGNKGTLFLQMLLKEVEFDGRLEVVGDVSYASQEPWIFPSTIKQNILFGEDLDDHRYKKILQVCCLEHDLSLLPLGDNTLIGERVMLSSGQIARIHLARALYKNADIYLLDNPLAAVEATITKKIFTEAIRSHLKEKCVLMVTNQLYCLRSMKKIFQLKKTKLVVTEKEIEEFDNCCDAKLEVGVKVVPSKKEFFNEINTSKILKRYRRFGGGKLAFMKILLMFLLVQLLVTGSDYFVTFWVNLEEQPHEFWWIRSYFTTNKSLHIYTLLLALLIMATGLSTWFFLKFCTTASTHLHQAMSSKIIHGTMAFFHLHSSGDILTHFSQDFGEVDESTPVTLKTASEMLLQICATGAIISFLNFYMIVPTLLLFGILLFYYRLFNNQGLVKFYAITQSSMYTHVAATIQGMSTIRSSKVKKMLQEEFEKHQDDHTSGFYTSIAINVAFNFWSDLTRVVYTGVTIFSFFCVKSFVGDVGLAITQALQFGVFQEAVKAFTDLNNSVVSIERVIEYSGVPSEPEGQTNVDTSWFKSGTIDFQKESFSVNSGETVGIVTSDASTFLSVLFRLSNFEGTLTIDGRNIKMLPLRVLRSNIFLVPSEPLIFPGSLRQNLDPFGEFNDVQIWNALRALDLENVVLKLPEVLNTEISGESSFFTTYQRRVLCLVRALLKNAKIIILYLTSDNQKMLKLVRRKFPGCTVLLISRSIKSVEKCEKIMVLDDGCCTKEIKKMFAF